MTVAVELGARLWRRAGAPFRPITDHVPRWLDDNPTSLTERARELFASLDVGDWLVHGDFHHHNVLRHTRGYVAIDPKPYLADREYDVYAWLHNPIPYELTREDVERRIGHFVAAGLDEHKVRAWSLIRAAYLMDDPRELDVMGSLL
jgi:streptomycin 6-kinase